MEKVPISLYAFVCYHNERLRHLITEFNVNLEQGAQSNKTQLTPPARDRDRDKSN